MKSALYSILYSLTFLLIASQHTYADPYAERVDQLFANKHTSKTPGLAVGIYHKGEMIYSQGYGLADLEQNVPITADTPFHVASVSKQFAAYSIALLVGDGLIDFDADIRRYLPYVPDYGEPIRVKDLVFHTTGFRDHNLMFWLAQRGSENILKQSQAIDIFKRQKTLQFKPGTAFSYNNTNYMLIAELVAAVTGQSFKDYTTEKIFKPLGMNRSFFFDDMTEIVPGRAYPYAFKNGAWHHAPINFELVGATGLLTTANDLIKWADNFRSPKVGNEDLIIRTTALGTLNNGAEFNYAFGLWHQNIAGRKAISHGGQNGSFRSVFAYFPEEEFAVAITANRPEDMLTPVEDIVKIYLGEGSETSSYAAEEAKPINIGTSELAAYTGHYVPTDHWSADIIERDGKLYWHSTVKNSAITLREKDYFNTGEGSGARYYQFKRTPNGQIKGFTAIDFWAKSESGLFTKKPKPSPDMDKLSALEGRYHIEEVDISYDFRVVDGQLQARSLWSRIPVKFSHTDQDQYDANTYPLGSLKVDYGHNKKPAGFTITAGGLTGIQLKKIQ